MRAHTPLPPLPPRAHTHTLTNQNRKVDGHKAAMHHRARLKVRGTNRMQGLGKTVQTIAFLAALLGKGRGAASGGVASGLSSHPFKVDKGRFW